MRKAQCHCGEVREGEDLPFRQSRDEGSSYSALCECGFAKIAHEYEASRVSPEPIKCRVGGYTPRGPHEYDSFYCGCDGWD